MSKRKHISWKTKCAAALLHLRCERDMSTYDDAKKMTEDQFLSLFHWDHNILHETGDQNRDMFWNLSPLFIAAHREKTKTDAKVIAKGRRIREKHRPPKEHATTTLVQLEKQLKTASYVRKLGGWDAKRTIQSRGFDKTLRKKMSGKVERR